LSAYYGNLHTTDLTFLCFSCGDPLRIYSISRFCINVKMFQIKSFKTQKFVQNDEK
jgi:hypothetical protein